ncbi:MAG: N-acetylmuramoyl-L-alanine amidase, partial [Firmicutes bacterium]|nr:N-acetylmuramoyl-L-alanine amidase [Bacillota bacterium]
MGKKKLRSVALAGLASLVAVTAVPTGDVIVAEIVSSKVKETIIIDPGHGGFDGGAESESGTAEKDINLAIGLE